MTEFDRYLGMDKKIQRRDFLQGISLGLGSLALGCTHFSASTSQASGPQAVGRQFRGQDDRTRDLGHFVRFGHQLSREYLNRRRRHTGEHYDLVVVGAGLAGLTAAYTFQKERNFQAKILIIDNGSEIGGRAHGGTGEP